MKRCFLILAFLPLFANGQSIFNPLIHDASLDLDNAFLKQGMSRTMWNSAGAPDSVYQTLSDTALYRPDRDQKIINGLKHPGFWKKLRTESLIQVRKGKFILQIDPILDLATGKPDTGKYLINTRGVLIRGQLAPGVTFYSGVAESQGYFEPYLKEYTRTRRVVPGQGRYKAFKEGGYDFANSFGALSFRLGKHVKTELGHGKHKIGDGYRSLLLSDVPMFYPYLKVSAGTKKIRYSTMFTAFQEVKSEDSRLLAYQRKHGTFSLLEYSPSKVFTIALFEGIIWRTTFPGGNNQFKPGFFVPVIGVRQPFLSYSGEHNVLSGLLVRASFARCISVYSQFMVDNLDHAPWNAENDRDRFGYQAGIKLLEPFKMKGLYLQAEYNRVRPFSYFSTSERQNYTAFNEPLAHPLGANFRELFMIVRYRYKDFYVEGRFTGSKQGTDTTGCSSGSNIFETTHLNFAGLPASQFQGQDARVKNLYLKAGFIINTANRLELSAGIHIRQVNAVTETKSTMVFVALKTSLWNHYYDF